MYSEKYKLIEKSLHISAPSWPLQNTVAVNPFWNLRDKSFHQVVCELTSTLNTSLYMPLTYYKEAIDSGEITKSALQESIRTHAKKNSNFPTSIEDFFATIEDIKQNQLSFKTLSQLYSHKNDIHSQIMIDFGKYASAYLDEKQAISVFPWNTVSFWDGWLQSQKNDRSMEYYGFKNFKKSRKKILKTNKN